MKFLPLTLTLLLGSSLSFAGNGKEGGDPTASRREFLAVSFVKLKSNLLDILPTVFRDVRDPEVRALLVGVDQAQLRSDIEKSSYSLAEACKDRAGHSHAASTELGEMGADICFDLTVLSAQNTSARELLGLALHEHLHHFGFGDSPAMYRVIGLLETLTDPIVNRVRLEVRTLISFYTPLKPSQIDENRRILGYYVDQGFISTLRGDIDRKYGTCAQAAGPLGSTALEISRSILVRCFKANVSIDLTF